MDSPRRGDGDQMGKLNDCEIVAHDRDIGENPMIAIRHVDASNSLRQDRTAGIR